MIYRNHCDIKVQQANQHYNWQFMYNQHWFTLSTMVRGCLRFEWHFLMDTMSWNNEFSSGI